MGLDSRKSMSLDLGVVGGHRDNLGAQLFTVRSGVGNLVALLSAQDCGTQRGLLREDLQIGAGGEGVLDLAGTKQELQVAARNLGLNDHTQGHDAVIDGGVANVGGLQQVLELLDACLVLGLLVAGGVVAAVLTEVALVACLRDAVDDFLAVRAGEVLQLLGEAVAPALPVRNE